MTWPLEATSEGHISPANLAPGHLADFTRGITVLALGPGLGQSDATAEFCIGLLEATTMPAVIDADALNLLAKHPDRLATLARGGRTVVLTPHPGEMARLAGLTTAEVQADRLGIARAFAARHGVTLVLKGARTIIAHPDGRAAVNTSGNPGMAKGGSGDLLTGVVAGLLAQFPRDPGRAVEAAVWLHGLAADLTVRDTDEHTCSPPTLCPGFPLHSAFTAAPQTVIFGCRDCRANSGTADRLQRGTGMTKDAPVAEGRVHQFTTHSGADTIEVGRKLAALLSPPQLLLLRGELGTGKTTLVKGIAQALDAADPDEVTSPTFTLIHEYKGERDGKPVKLFHLDVYRLEGERQLDTLGLDELLTPDALVLVEWGEKFPSLEEARHRRDPDHVGRRRRHARSR